MSTAPLRALTSVPMIIYRSRFVRENFFPASKNVLRLTGSTGKTVKLGDVVVDTEKGTAMKNNKDLFLFCAGIPSSAGFHQQSGDRADTRTAA